MCQPQPIPYSDEKTFSAAKWRWHEAVLFDHLLPEASRCIGSFIAHRANWQECGAYPSQLTIAHALGFSPSKVKRYMKPLFERGWLGRVRRGLGMTNLYVLTADPNLADAVETVQRIYKDRREQLRTAKRAGSTVDSSTGELSR